MTSLVVGCHARALWPNGASYAYSYYGTLIGTPTPGIQWYKFRPPGVTPNRGMGPPLGPFCQVTLTSCCDYLCILTIKAIFSWLQSLCCELLWAPAQRKRATMLYFANVFFLFIFFYGRLILRPWLTEVRENFTRGRPWVSLEKLGLGFFPGHP